MSRATGGGAGGSDPGRLSGGQKFEFGNYGGGGELGVIPPGADQSHVLHTSRRQRLSVRTDAAGSGYVLYLGRQPGDDPALSAVPFRTEISADANVTLGPYPENAQFRVYCTQGKLIAKVV